MQQRTVTTTTHDPTDDYRFIEQEQMLRGICSEPDCLWPIAAWCVDPGCRAKLCLDHLHDHRNQHARARMAERMAPRCADCGERLTSGGNFVWRGDQPADARTPVAERWYCADEAACIERAFARHGGAIYDEVMNDEATVTADDDDRDGGWGEIIL